MINRDLTRGGVGKASCWLGNGTVTPAYFAYVVSLALSTITAAVLPTHVFQYFVLGIFLCVHQVDGLGLYFD